METGPWSPCTLIGPGADSSQSCAIAVNPSIVPLSITFVPFTTTVTVRPTSRIS